MKRLLGRLLLIISVALVPALVFQLYIESQARNIRQHLVEDEALRLVRLVASEQQRIVEGAEQVLDAISASPAVQDNHPEPCQRLLANILHLSPRYNYGAVIGLDGHLLCAPTPFDRSIDMSDRAYFRLALQTGGVAVGDYTVGRLSGERTIHVAKPFRNRDGGVAGVVSIALNVDWLAKQVQRLPLPPEAIVTVADRTGTFMVRHPGQERFAGTSIPPQNRFILEGKEVGVALLTSLDRSRPTIVAYSPLDADPKGLSIGVGLDRETTFAAVTQANQLGMMLILLSAALAIATTALLGGRLIGRPVNRLLAAAEHWRNGDFATRTGMLEDGSEFGQLGAAFDGMAVAQEAREQALRRSEENFRATFDQVAVGMAQVGLDGRFLRVNDRLCAITGYTRDELQAHTFSDITHPDDVQTDLQMRERLLKGAIAIFVREKRYLRRDGGFVWVTVTASLLRAADGRPERILVVVEDITARKRVEAALQASEARLRAVMEQTPAAFAIMEPPDGAVVIRSQYSDVVFGTHGAQSLAASSARRNSAEHPDGRPYATEEYPSWRALNRGETILAEPMLYRRTDGRLIDLEVYAAPVRDTAGAIIASVTAAFDVSARNRAERLLAQSNTDLEARVRAEVAAREEAQIRAAHVERVQALGQLAGGIAHDFNNVLQAIEGAVLLIDRDAGGNAVIRRMVRMALEASARGASITRRLLTFGRRGDLRSEAIDPVDMLAGLQELLTHTLGAGTEVEVTIAAGIPLILADKGQLETVLVNLATNARDAMPAGGRLTIFAAAENVRADAAAHPAELAPGRYVRLTVADTGIGMDAAMLAHVGEPFFTTKEPGVGTGLGLAMAKGFAAQSGGALRIESSPGKGTTVSLWLPEADPDSRPRAAAADCVADTAASGTGKTMISARLLLVDDEELVREVLAEHLKDAGFSVLVAAGGVEALTLIAAGEVVDALVTDLSMPGIDGIAVIRAAQECHPRLPAVLLTGYAGDDAALALGATITGPFSLLRKPIRIHELVDRIQIVLLAAQKGVA